MISPKRNRWRPCALAAAAGPPAETRVESLTGGVTPDPDLLARQRAELFYWRGRLDDIATEWFRNLLSVSGAAVALIAIAFSTGIDVGSIAYAIAFPILPVYLNNYSALGWNARETLARLSERYIATSVDSPVHDGTVWEDREVRGIPRRVPGANLGALSLIALMVPGYLYALNYLVQVVALDFFDNPKVANLDLNFIASWGLVLLSATVTVVNASMVFAREIRGYLGRARFD